MTLKTPDDWWRLLEAHWANILDIFTMCQAPLTGYLWREVVGGEVLEHEHTMLWILEEARRTRDHAMLVKYLNACWAAAPDQLCDLCSEAWVFDPEEQGEQDA